MDACLQAKLITFILWPTNRVLCMSGSPTISVEEFGSTGQDWSKVLPIVIRLTRWFMLNHSMMHFLQLKEKSKSNTGDEIRNYG